MSSAYRANKSDESHHLNLSATQRFDYLTKVYWDWAAYLRPSETVLLGWIMSNTIGRDKRSGYYSLNHLVRGVGKRSIGDKKTGGTGLSRKTIQRATESLEKRGVITTYIHRKGKVYTIVLDWDPTAGQDGGINVVPLRPYQTSRQASQQDDDDDY